MLGLGTFEHHRTLSSRRRGVHGLWVWMMIDAVVRDTREYPAGVTRSSMWVLLIAFVQPAFAIQYFFVTCASARPPRAQRRPRRQRRAGLHRPQAGAMPWSPQQRLHAKGPGPQWLRGLVHSCG